MTDPTTACVIYAAKSTIDKHGSIPTQIEDCRKVAKREKWEVVAVHQDEAASAYSGDRGDGLARALEECERLAHERRTCCLIVQHSDRLARGDGREAKHLVEYAIWAIKTGVRIVSVQDPEMLPQGEMALLLAAVGGMRNHQDSKRKSESVQNGLRTRARVEGKLCGGQRPYGYRWTGRKGRRGSRSYPPRR